MTAAADHDRHLWKNVQAASHYAGHAVLICHGLISNQSESSHVGAALVTGR